MNRLDNWQANLSDVIRDRRERPFAWGTDDCTQFAFDAVKAVIGTDYGVPYRGKYSTAKGALRILKKVGGVETPAELMAKLLGPSQPIAFARKGDVVTCDPDAIGFGVQDGVSTFGPLIGVCYGHLSYFVAEAGVATVETLQCASCFHVLIRGGE
jgi:hypothetical protein